MGATPLAEEVRQQAAVEQAMSGDLPCSEGYSLQHNSSYRAVIPPIFCTNLDIGQGAAYDVYMDFQNGCVVLDFGGE